MIAGLAIVYQGLTQQAAAMSFLDAYVVLGKASAAMFFASFLLKSNDPKHTEVKSGHWPLLLRSAKAPGASREQSSWFKGNYDVLLSSKLRLASDRRAWAEFLPARGGERCTGCRSR